MSGSLSPLPPRRRNAAAGGVVIASLILVLSLLAILPAKAEERILAFASDVTLQLNGSVAVTETIDVEAEGTKIRRGIFRDIPTLLRNADNSRLRSDLEVVGVTRDGSTEPYTVELIGNGFKRIRIGDPDVLLSTGPHRYTISYTMSRMARHFADHDELFWNATGNFWDFPIDTAVARVTLPAGAVISKLVGYTGATGSTEQAVTVTRKSDTEAIFRTTRSLQRGEGLSVAVAFPTGVLVADSGSTALLDWLSDHRDLVFPLFGVLLVFAYNLFAWNKVGRDPKKGVVIPLFHPPQDMSPGLMHFVHKYGWGRNGWTAFTASIFDLGVKGLVTIDNSTKTLRVSTTAATPSEALGAGEAELYDFLGRRQMVSIDKSNGPALEKTRMAFVQAIEKQNRGVYFRNNLGYVFLGFLLCAAIVGGMVIFEVITGEVALMALGVGLALGIVVPLLLGARSGRFGSFAFIALWVIIAGFNFGGSVTSFFSSLQIDVPLIATASILFIEIAFALIMRAPTVQGRAVMDQIDGFKMYLDTAEKNRLNMDNEPPMTVKRFERILPYAIALGVEKPWSAHFEGELARNAVSDADGSYQPVWYTGRRWNEGSGGFSNSVAAVTSGMSAAMMASQPSSSSGSGFSSGGGGSGGGGGGGGGGGW